MLIKEVSQLVDSIKKLYDLGIQECKFDTHLINKNEYYLYVYSVSDKNRVINIKLDFEGELIEYFNDYVKDEDLLKRLEKYFKDWE